MNCFCKDPNRRLLAYLDRGHQRVYGVGRVECVHLVVGNLAEAVGAKLEPEDDDEGHEDDTNDEGDPSEVAGLVALNHEDERRSVQRAPRSLRTSAQRAPTSSTFNNTSKLSSVQSGNERPPSACVRDNLCIQKHGPEDETPRLQPPSSLNFYLQNWLFSPSISWQLATDRQVALPFVAQRVP